MSYIEKDTSKLGIILELTKRLGQKHQEVSCVERANAAYCLSMLAFNDKTFSLLFEKTYECCKESIERNVEIQVSFGRIARSA